MLPVPGSPGLLKVRRGIQREGTTSRDVMPAGEEAGSEGSGMAAGRKDRPQREEQGPPVSPRNTKKRRPFPGGGREPPPTRVDQGLPRSEYSILRRSGDVGSRKREPERLPSASTLNPGGAPRRIQE
jgi:hypothetical protein